ncbi:MAG: sulfotransferase family protein [Gaiellales bacterium]
MRRNDRGAVLRWAARTRRRHHLAGSVLRTAAPILPRRPAPQDPVFILGSPRSGTTMLFALLDRSPHLASLGIGSHFLWEMFHPIEAAGFASHAVGPEQVSDAERRVLDWSIDRLSGGLRYLDKYPRMCLRAEYLHALYPDAQFVYIARDGRAAVSSLITGWRTEGKFGQGTVLPVPLDIEGYGGDVWKFLVPPGWRDYARGRTLAEVCAFQWQAANEAVLDAREQIGDERWIDVTYEALVAEPVQTTRAILEHLRLPADGVLEWAATLETRVSRTAVTPPRPDKWRDENPREIESILPMIAPTMERLGYPVDLASA